MRRLSDWTTNCSFFFFFYIHCLVVAFKLSPLTKKNILFYRKNRFVLAGGGEWQYAFQMKYIV